ncbi:phosphotransferase enzyme family protein [Fibrobacterota bacterium]
MKDDREWLKAIGSEFAVDGRFVSGAPFGSGHINDTSSLVYEHEGKTTRYVLQRINDNVFKNPRLVMENMSRVCSHQLARLKEQGTDDAGRRCLQLVHSKDGQPFHVDRKGGYWRVCPLIERAHTCDKVESEALARTAGQAFGQFQKQVVGLPGERLHETIPDFHNTEKRYVSLEGAIKADSCKRVDSCTAEIAFIKERREIVSVINDLMAAGEIPDRITHNDTKLNNVMIDDDTGEALCVIDLDTVMPGSALFDFGDMVRTATSPALEDEKDLSLVQIQVPLFKGLTEGYLSETGNFLTQAEREHLAFSGKLITFEQGIRFLTDYLEGDCYYKTGYGNHNLVRARNQLKLVESIEENEKELESIVKNY